MKLLRLLLLALLAFAVSAGTPKPAETTDLKIIVGATDDTAKWMNRQDGIVGVHRDLRLMVVRVTIPWKPGQGRPTRLQQVYLHRIARMVQLSDRVVLAVYNTARHAPTTARLRKQYCSFLGGVVRRIPLIHDVEIWNEANSPAYWPKQTARRGTPRCLRAATTSCTTAQGRSTSSARPLPATIRGASRSPWGTPTARADERAGSSTRSATTHTQRTPRSRPGSCTRART